MRYVAPVALAIILVLGGCRTVPRELAADFPARDEASAIRIAKYVCRREAGPDFQWQANFVASHRHWIVDTEPSLHKSGDPLWMVEIPVDGPLPKRCWRSFYDIITPSGAISTGG
jgi:hypothetical protein